MTRYTKLEGKARAPLKASDHFGEKSASAADKSAPEAPPTTESAASKDEKPLKRKAEDDAKITVKAVKTSTDEASSPAKLLKRVKLLRLKAKKAKTEEKRSAFLKEAKELDKQASALNGENGKAAGVKSSDGKRRADSREGAMGAKRRRTDAGSDAPAPDGENPWKRMERGEQKAFWPVLNTTETIRARFAERREENEVKSDHRRQKRAEERTATLRCYACRAMGHSASNCPNKFNAEAEDLNTSAAADSEMTGKDAVGICFRCGSRDHILANCRRSTPRVGAALPFATCFVCSEKGHLASTCPKNAGKGVYPNGGSCKLCESVEHLAKDCPLRKENATVASAAVISSNKGGASVGADEDDFHEFARKKREVDRGEARVTGKQKKTGAILPQTASGRKVITF